MKNLLIPVDFSPQARQAVSVGVSLAAQAGAVVHLLHVIEPIRAHVVLADALYVDTSVEDQFIRRLTDSAKKQLEELSQAHSASAVSIKQHVRVGSLFSVVQEVAEELKIDFLITGTSGASGLEEILVGSNTERIVRFAPCPVLAVKEGSQWDNPQEIVFASNLQTQQAPALRFVQQLQHLLQAKLRLVYVNTPGDFISSRQVHKLKDELLKVVPLDNYDLTIYQDEREDIGIRNFAEDIGCPLIVMTTHQRKGISHFLSGSIAEDVVNHAKQMVLTIGLKS
jgi:nucleotide-binding universal stress UspA family protein